MVLTITWLLYHTDFGSFCCYMLLFPSPLALAIQTLRREWEAKEDIGFFFYLLLFPSSLALALHTQQREWEAKEDAGSLLDVINGGRECEFGKC